MVTGKSSTVASVTAPQSQKGVVVADEAEIYQDADFDSKVIGKALQGQIYEIAMAPRGPFYRIRLKPGVLGWISDAEIRPTKQKTTEIKSQPEIVTKVEKTKKSEPEKNKVLTPTKPIFVKRFRGPAYESIYWTEDTMGSTHSENMSFIGANWFGYNTAMAGELYTDSSLLFAFSAPRYYEAATGYAATGWILKMNMAFQTPSPLGKSSVLFYGFGPSFTYSHFGVALNDSGTKVNYSLDDISLGILLNAGIAFRLGPVTPRLCLKYYIEKKSMSALGFSLGFEF